VKNYVFDQIVNQCGDIVFEKSIEGVLKSATPGEWVSLESKKSNKSYIGYANPFRTDGRVVRIVCERYAAFDANGYVAKKVSSAIEFRQKFLGEKGARLFFGSSDGIPGLVIDKFKNVIVIQYHMLGVLAVREAILSVLGQYYPDMKLCESAKPESGEEMQAMECVFPEFIEIEEQGIDYRISRERFQKTGFYYDHRSNRTRLFNFYKSKSITPTKVLDLYSYLGSWSVPFHYYLGSSITCVDQADLELEFKQIFSRYPTSTKSRFVRSSVSKYLDEVSEEFDLIICDPPAFKKGQDKKREALNGYDSLVKKIVPKLKVGSGFAFSSCTHGIEHKDLDALVSKAAHRVGKKLQLVDMGLQDIDHPMMSLNDKSMYIKYLLYICKE